MEAVSTTTPVPPLKADFATVKARQQGTMRLESMAARAGLLSVLVALAGPASAAAVSSPIVVVPGAEHYTAAPAPFGHGIMIAVLSGNPKAAGTPYTLRLRLPDGARIPVHTHGSTENVTVIQGQFMVGLGSTFDASKLKGLPAGAYVSVPPGLAHYAMAKGLTVVDVSGIGPEETSFL
jgi:Cupin